MECSKASISYHCHNVPAILAFCNHQTWQLHQVLAFQILFVLFFCVFTLMLQISVNIVFTKWREVVYPENGLAFDGNNPAVNDLSSIILWVTVRNTLTQCWIVHNWFIWSHLLKYLIIVDWVGQIKILWLKLHSWNVECAISVVWC